LFLITERIDIFCKLRNCSQATRIFSSAHFTQRVSRLCESDLPRAAFIRIKIRERSRIFANATNFSNMLLERKGRNRILLCRVVIIRLTTYRCFSPCLTCGARPLKARYDLRREKPRFLNNAANFSFRICAPFYN